MSRPLVDVRLDALCTRSGQEPYLEDVSVHVRYGEFFTFLGPPHSGKSAVLRAIAGFLPLAAGRVLVDAEDIGHLPPRQRGIGYVFHEGALWPHITVREHVEFGLRQMGLTATEMDRRGGTGLGGPGLAAAPAPRPGGPVLPPRPRPALARARPAETPRLLLHEPPAPPPPPPPQTLPPGLA